MMTEAEIRELAADYLGIFEKGPNANGKEARALEKMGRLCRTDATLGLRAAWVAVNMVPSDDVKALAFLGAGPLEDLVNHHGDEVLSTLLETARESVNFCIALTCVCHSKPGDSIWAELAQELTAIRARHGGNC